MASLSIIERKQKESELLRDSRSVIQASEERYRLIFTSSPLGIVQIDKDGIIVTVNQKFADFMGTSVEDLIGFNTLADLKNPGLLAAVHAILEGKEGYFEGEYVPGVSGKRLILRMLGKPLIRHEGGVTGAISIFEDITDRKQMEEALFRANAKLNLLNSITRHDILNQIMALTGFLELSRDPENDTERQRYFIERAKKAADTIEHQINFTRDYQDMGVKSAIWQDIGGVIVSAKGKLPVEDLAIETADTEYEIFADPLFEKVFYNLIDNSIKHGGSRLTSIKVYALEREEWLEIIYEDDGGGVPDDMKQSLFEHGGGPQKGLGMILTRQILAITGITIKETGISGKGARFEIRVPIGGYRRKGKSV